MIWPCFSFIQSIHKSNLLITFQLQEIDRMLHAAAPGPLSYTDFDPRSEWLRGEDFDTLLLDVSGFKKEQMRVLINTLGSLKVSGERPLDGRRWTRFLKEFNVDPKICNPRAIQAKFDKDTGLLYVVLPKLHATRPATRIGSSETMAKPVSSSSQRGKTDSGIMAATRGEEDGPETITNHGHEAKDDSISGNYGSLGDERMMQKARLRRRTSRHKLFILGIVTTIAILVGVGSYAVYKLRFAPQKSKN